MSAGDDNVASRPAEMLTGLDLANGWKVVSMIPSFPGGTGSAFSTPYVVERGEQQAFLKAIDFTRALADDDPARALEQMTRIFNFERDLVRSCTDRQMPNVVQVLDEGSLTVPDGGPVPRVNYLIFELADGDIRRIMQLSTDLDAAWAFRSLKDIALGLTQLHADGIAHQDLKPSNVLGVKGVYKETSAVRAGAASRGHSMPCGSPGIRATSRPSRCTASSWRNGTRDGAPLTSTISAGCSCSCSLA